MATSGSKKYTVQNTNGHISIEYRWVSTTPNAAGNYSTVKVEIYVHRGSLGYNTDNSPDPWALWINGTRYNGSNGIAGANNTSTLLHSYSQRINHNSDGSGSFTVQYRKTFGLNFGSTYIGEQTFPLVTFHLDSFASSTYSTISYTDSPTVGQPFDFEIERKNLNYTHKVDFKVGSSVLANQVDMGKKSSFRLIFTRDEWLLAYSSAGSSTTSFTATLNVFTYNGTTLIGYDTKSVTVYPPEKLYLTSTTFGGNSYPYMDMGKGKLSFYVNDDNYSLIDGITYTIKITDRNGNYPITPESNVSTGHWFYKYIDVPLTTSQRNNYMNTLDSNNEAYLILSVVTYSYGRYVGERNYRQYYSYTSGKIIVSSSVTPSAVETNTAVLNLDLEPTTFLTGGFSKVRVMIPSGYFTTEGVDQITTILIRKGSSLSKTVTVNAKTNSTISVDLGSVTDTSDITIRASSKWSGTYTHTIYPKHIEYRKPTAFMSPKRTGISTARISMSLVTYSPVLDKNSMNKNGIKSIEVTVANTRAAINLVQTKFEAAFIDTAPSDGIIDVFHDGVNYYDFVGLNQDLNYTVTTKITDKLDQVTTIENQTLPSWSPLLQINHNTNSIGLLSPTSYHNKKTGNVESVNDNLAIGARTITFAKQLGVTGEDSVYDYNIDGLDSARAHLYFNNFASINISNTLEVGGQFTSGANQNFHVDRWGNVNTYANLNVRKNINFYDGSTIMGLGYSQNTRMDYYIPSRGWGNSQTYELTLTGVIGYAKAKSTHLYMNKTYYTITVGFSYLHNFHSSGMEVLFAGSGSENSAPVDLIEVADLDQGTTKIYTAQIYNNTGYDKDKIYFRYKDGINGRDYQFKWVDVREGKNLPSFGPSNFSDGVVDSSFSTSGSYIKFSDGTLIYYREDVIFPRPSSSDISESRTFIRSFNTNVVFSTSPKPVVFLARSTRTSTGDPGWTSNPGFPDLDVGTIAGSWDRSGSSYTYYARYITPTGVLTPARLTAISFNVLIIGKWS